MKRLPTCVIVLLVTAVAALDARGKAAYAGKPEMVRDATAVAVVEVTRVDPVEVRGGHWTYRQRAAARVETVLRGDLPKGGAIDLHGHEDFICARCEFAPGRYLVFLRRDGRLWVGSNWHLSVRPIATGPDGGETVD